MNPNVSQDPKRMALIRIWDTMMRAARQYVMDRGFTQVHNMPEIVGVTGACENIDTLFRVELPEELYDKPVIVGAGKDDDGVRVVKDRGRMYLAQSDQLYLELLTPFLGKVWAEIQSFRAEPEADDRHLWQFTLFEIEHLGDLDELIGNIRGIVQAMATAVAMKCRGELSLFSRNPEDILREAGMLAANRMTYRQAVTFLQANGYPELVFGDDLKAHHERVLTDKLGPLFVTHYPLPIKFFNMLQNENDPEVVNSCDLLLPKAGESAGASEREHEYERLCQRLRSHSMYKRLIELGGKDEDFHWYLDAHKNKEVALHSGAGIGVARVSQWLLGVEDIREAVPFLINPDCVM